MRKSLYLAAAMTCLWPATVNAQSWNPTASDAKYNTAAGGGALTNHLSGTSSNNTAVGYNALSIATGPHNTAVGFAALDSDTTGGYNTGYGSTALSSNTTGNNNVAVGFDALAVNAAGSDNVAVGLNTLMSSTTGKSNVAAGSNALISLASGSGNIALGDKAGKNLTTGSRNIYIGHTGAAGGSESGVIRIGQVQTKTFIAGIAGVAASGATVVVKANGQLGVVASSARYKTGIHDLTDTSDRLAQLRPVSYQYKTEPGVTHFGLIAEEVDKVMPELVVRDEQNRPETVQYQELIPLLLQQVKQLKAEVAELRRTRLAGAAAR